MDAEHDPGRLGRGAAGRGVAGAAGRRAAGVYFNKQQTEKTGKEVRVTTLCRVHGLAGQE
eukprot:3277754-Rhodomonas_salina.1